MEDRFKDLVRSLTKRSTAATVEATDEVCDRSGEDEDQAVCSKDCDVVPAEHVSRAMAKLPAPKLLTRIREKTPQGKVKDPEQTPTKATDSAKESAAKRGKGRPTKDRFAQLRTGMKELRDAGAASRKFFGGEWKNVSRNWAKYILAIDQQIEEEQDESMLPDLEHMAKKSRVAFTVLNAVSRLKCNRKLAIIMTFLVSISYTAHFEGCVSLLIRGLHSILMCCFSNTSCPLISTQVSN